MENKKAKVSFLVQGSQPEPYEVKFWTDGNRLYGSCTCQAGMNKFMCKHRFSLLEGDTSKVISNNAKDISKLMQMLEGTSVEKVYKEILLGMEAEMLLKSKFKLKSSHRKTKINPVDAIPVLNNNGFIKSRTNYCFDVFDETSTYIGTIETQENVFSIDIAEMFPGLNLIVELFADNSKDKNNKNIYCFTTDSILAKAYRSYIEIEHNKYRLRKIITDY